jgi:hypothetical protein
LFINIITVGHGKTVDRWPIRHDLGHHVTIPFKIDYKKVKTQWVHSIARRLDPPGYQGLLVTDNIVKSVIKNLLMRIN